MLKVKPGTFLGRPASHQSGVALPNKVIVKNRSNHHLTKLTERVRDIQSDLERALLDLDNAQCEEEINFYQEHATLLKEHYDHAVIKLQAAHKLWAELVFAQKKLKTDNQVDKNLTRKRIIWLEERIKIVVSCDKSDDFHLNKLAILPPCGVVKAADVTECTSEFQPPVLPTCSTSVDENKLAIQLPENNGLTEEEKPNKQSATDSVSVAISENNSIYEGQFIRENTAVKDAEEVENQNAFSYASTESIDDIESRRNKVMEPEPASYPSSPVVGKRMAESCDNYWNSEHHRMSYSNLQHVGSLFYHQIPLCIQGTYVDNVSPTAKLPWRPRRHSSEFVDTQAKALNDLSAHVGKFCSTVREASKLSISVRGQQQLSDVGSYSSMKSPDSTVSYSRVPGLQLKQPASSFRLPPCTTTHSRHSQIISHSLQLDRSSEFPQTSENFSASIPGHDVAASRIVDQRNLLEETQQMTRLFKSKRGSRVKPASVESHFWQLLNEDAMQAQTPFVLAAKCNSKRDNLAKTDLSKWSRVQDLVRRCRISLIPDERTDCVRQLGALQCHDEQVTDVLYYLLANDREDRVIYEATKSLIVLGCWSDDVQQNLVHYLLDGTMQLKLDLVQAMSRSQDIADDHKQLNTFRDLCRILSLFCCNDDVTNDLSFHAAVCLHHFGVTDDKQATAKLSLVVQTSSDVHRRAKALALLVHRKEVQYDEETVKEILKQLQHSVVWAYRRDAAKHLVYLNLMDWEQMEPFADSVYDVLFKSLCDDVSRDVRQESAKALTALGLIGRACLDVDRMLVDEKSDKARAHAVVAIGTLGMKGDRIIKCLLDMAQLDVSHHVRSQVLRTFGELRVRDERILHLLRVKADGRDELLAREARRSLKSYQQ